jgi:DNA-binding response OmpR family regulator
MAEATVLVVTDHEPLRTQVCDMLRRGGFEAIPARNGVEAHWYAEQHGALVDLVLTELLPPESDGYHGGPALSRLLAAKPVVYTSCWPHAETVRRGILHPAAAYLQHPFPPNMLARKVRETLVRWGDRPKM